MLSYILILTLSFLIPFIFSFERQIYFIQYFKIVLKSILLVAIPYLIWDSIFTDLKIWGFVNEKIIGFRLVGLPLEEILFFIVVPYALIFIYEVVNFYIKDKLININRPTLILLGSFFFILSVLSYPKTYSSIQFFLTALFFGLPLVFKWNITNTKNFWITILISIIPFLVVNYFLTSIPIVIYNENEILGIRFLTIPLEDFFYHFIFTSSNLIVYNYFKSKQ